MRILTALLILGALLFVIRMVRETNKPPFTTEITTCTDIVNGEVIAVTVEGTVQAHKKQDQIRLTAFANRRIVGSVALGDFEAGQEKPFRVTGNIPSQERKPLSCRVELKSLAP
jgi:hypothetical protein